MQSIVQKCINIGFSGNPQALCSLRARTQVMSFGRILSRATASKTEFNERQLINDMKALRKSVADFNRKIREVSEPKQIELLNRLKLDSPPEWSVITSIGQSKREIVGLEISMMQQPPGPGLANTSQLLEQERDQERDQENIIRSCHITTTDDPAIGPYPRTMAEAISNSAGPVNGQQLPDVVPRHRQAGNIDQVIERLFSGTFQCQTKYMELKKIVGFWNYILDATFSPTGKNLIITGCNGDDVFNLGIWRPGADGGNWVLKGEIGDSGPIRDYEFNQAENTLLSSSRSGNVRVSTLNSDGCWEETVVLALTPHHEDYPPVQVTFSPLQDKIMAYDPQAGNIIVLRKYSNGRWLSLTQPKGISHYQQTGPQQPHFKATDKFFLAYCGRTVTIWGFSDKGNYLVEKGVFECDRNIASAQLSDDERHAVVFTWGSQALFLGCDDDGNWSQVGNIRHPETMIDDDNQAHTNLICQATFNASGQHAMTRDIDNKVIISGYDDSGAWVRKAEIQDCVEARFSPSGHKLLARHDSGRFRLWDCKSTGERFDNSQVLEHTGSREVVFSPSENRLLSYGHESHVACIWGNDEEGNLVEEAKVCHQEGIDYAAFNAREDSVLTHGRDHTVKIQGLDNQGKWQEQLVFHNPNNIPDAGASTLASILTHILPNNILHARFSPSGRLACFVCLDDTACILGQDDNGQWTIQAEPDSGIYSIDGAEFNGLDNHFLTYGITLDDKNHSGLVQLWGIGSDGKWVEKEQIKLVDPVRRAAFSPDGEHLVIYSNDDQRGLLLSESGSASLWKIPTSPGQETAHP